MNNHYHVSLPMCLLLTIFLSIVTIMAGCGGGGGGVGSYPGDLGYPGNISTPTYSPAPIPTTYTVSGRITDLRGLPVSSVTVSLYSGSKKAYSLLGQAQTDSDGNYIIGGIAAGAEYTLGMAHSSFVETFVHGLEVSYDSYFSYGIPTSDDLSDVTHPFDAARGYVIVKALQDYYETPVANVAMAIEPASEVVTGYITDHIPPGINWNAASTYNNGQAIFAYLAPDQPYTVTLTFTGYDFPALSIISPAAGTLDIIQAYGTVK